MMLKQYFHILHGQWPSAHLEPLPELDERGQTSVPGVYIAGDLTGVPLLKLAAEGGARVVREVEGQLRSKGVLTSDLTTDSHEMIYDLAIIGCGVAGSSAALEAKKRGLSFILYEASSPYATIKDFTQHKPIFTYPEGVHTESELNVEFDQRESLIEGLEAQLREAEIEVTQARIVSVKRDRQGLLKCERSRDDSEEPRSDRAHHVLIAIGRSGDFRRLGVVGEDQAHVSSALRIPQEYAGQQVAVIGGGDRAAEGAIALCRAGAEVTMIYRGRALTRPKPELIATLRELEASGDLRLQMSSEVVEIRPHEVQVRVRDVERDSPHHSLIPAIPAIIPAIPAKAVFTLIGREAPLDFLRRCGIKIQGDWSLKNALGLSAFLIFCVALYHWKSYGWYPHSSLDPRIWIANLSSALSVSEHDRGRLIYTLLKSASQPSFYYTLLYSITIMIYGWRRIKRRATPYVRLQTSCLIAVQVIPLFLLPEVILPWMGRNGFFHEGALLREVADVLFESYDGSLGEERAYWRSYGFILAWPLMLYNVITHQPLTAWLVISALQTFVVIPLLVYRWGKGAFCGWICSCGALAETLGDTHRHKMPHGVISNRFNMIGQVILGLAFLLLGLRVWGWIDPSSWANHHVQELLSGASVFTYKWSVDVALAGFLGVGLYFHYSGRVWCRFACPLAALMNIYGRFSRFRIFAQRERCISCQVCTRVCHQGIDVMSFASRGLPMEDPQCVRCSACVQSCPTGVLQFGRIDREGRQLHDSMTASLVQIQEPQARE